MLQFLSFAPKFCSLSLPNSQILLTLAKFFALCAWGFQPDAVSCVVNPFLSHRLFPLPRTAGDDSLLSP
ncbi:hypothetical protein EVA_03327 [gut metagenome]|uniref:Uncharacterized protein n=1 Tax=gut metagenome TaxID=749906 RepID=J9GM55_9ZZZZ